MTFSDLLISNNYVLTSKTDNLIRIDNKSDSLADIIIIFDKQENLVTGYLKPKKVLFSLTDISHIYTLFRQMRKDAKLFADFAKMNLNEIGDEN